MSFIKMKQCLSILCFSFGSVICEEATELSRQAEVLRVPLRFDVSGRHLTLSRLFLAFKKNRLRGLRGFPIYLLEIAPHVAALLMAEKEHRQSRKVWNCVKLVGKEESENREDLSILKNLKGPPCRFIVDFTTSLPLCFP